MSDAKPLTTRDVERMRTYYSESAVLVERDELLATTRALEKLEEGLKLWHGLPPDERDMVAIENAGELWRRAVAERDSAIARAEKAERERDEVLIERDELVDVEIDFAEVERERDEARAHAAELVEALDGLFVEYDILVNAGSKYALTYWVDRLPDHACAECIPGGPIVKPGFRCREHAARAALAKAKAKGDKP